MNAKFLITILSMLFISNASAYLGGGEGSQGGGAAQVAEFMVRAKNSSYGLKVPSVKLKDSYVHVTNICFDEKVVRTFDFTDNYPEFVDIYKVPKDIVDAKYKAREKYNISLTKKKNFDFAGGVRPVHQPVKTVQYIIPKCN